MEEKYILAIEIGSSNIKGAVGAIDEDGSLKVVAIETERQIDNVRHGLVMNVENVSNRILSIIRKLENRVSPRKARSVYLSIGGRSYSSSPRVVERQLPSEEMISEDLINQLRKEALRTALSDREVVDVVDSEYFIDHRQDPCPIGTFGQNIRAKFNLITCRLQVRRNIVRAIEDRLQLKINGMIVRQLAEGDIVLTSDLCRKGCMLVDFGAETTTVSIYKNGGLIYMNTIPLGSRNITRDIMSLNYLEERAEELKIVGGHANPAVHEGKQVIDGLDFTDINDYVSARATEIAANIHEQLNIANIKGVDLPGGIVLIGGGAKLKGFSQLLEKITKMSVTIGMTSPTLRISDTHASAYDSIDVISILAAAAKLPNVVECMTRPEPVRVVNTTEPIVETIAEPPVGDDHEIDRQEAEQEAEELTDGGGSIFTDDDDDDLKDVKIKTPRSGKKLFNKITSWIERNLSEGDDDDEE